MKVCHTLICFFFLFSLQDGNTGLVSAQLSVYSGIEGENVTVQCSLSWYETRMFFCKEPCEQEDILIETTDATAQRGRYSIDYKDGVFFVTITQLTKSDSGRYRCGADTSLTRTSYKYIEIIVVDAMLDGDPSAEKTIDARTGGNIVVQCNFTQYRYKKYFCKEECEGGDNLVEMTSKSDQENGRYRIRYTHRFSTGYVLYVSIKQLTKSDSGWYRCGLGITSSRDRYQRFRLIVTDGLLCVCLFLFTALTTSTPSSSVPSASSTTTNQSESSTTTPASPKTTKHPETTKGRGFVKPNVRNQNLMWKHNMLLHRRLKTTRVNTPTPRSHLSASARPTAVSTVTLSVLSTLFLRWKLALMSPLCTLLYSTVNDPQ
ncbi:uncharacterized protein LOC117483359 isoform X12 [Trematomus bernacchii]|uniref:uncharacterized protein LOC117483359 isoform X12 n=1 Tax=Trematomus bernacchii TaxID=40690 RepID=UPI00146F2AD4|nr:uncharacterized protein LOC117483359 isoform X12 [Trematomus bernacchii]